jgi:hypothetical protein
MYSIYSFFLFIFTYFVVLWIEPRASLMLGKSSTTKLPSQLYVLFSENTIQKT